MDPKKKKKKKKKKNQVGGWKAGWGE